MNEHPDDDARNLIAAILGDVRTTAILFRIGDDLAAALLDLVDAVCGDNPRPTVVAVGGSPPGGRPVLSAANDGDVPALLRQAGIERLLTAHVEAIPGSAALPPALLSYLARQSRRQLPAVGEDDALFERMRKLGYL